MMNNESQILKGDARHTGLPHDSVDCIVTSPPYWGQRKYRGPALIWDGRNACRHRWAARIWYTERSAGVSTAEAFSKPGKANVRRLKAARWRRDASCSKCGAWHGQLGLEPTPELYVQHLVEIFREARRVLKPTGTCWLVISDSRPSNRGAGGRLREGMKQATNQGCQVSHDVRSVPANRQSKIENLKSGDMLGLPHDLVKALRADGWYWRDEIIWAKPNGFCESVRTRVTRNHEFVFLLTKSPSPKYFFDVEAIMEPCRSGPSDQRKMIESKPRIGGLNKQLRDPLMKASALTNAGRKRSLGGFVRLEREGINSRMHQDRDVFHPAARKARRKLPADTTYPYLTHAGWRGPHDLGEKLYRRKRSVWTVAVSKPRGLKHYATFPEKLIQPMILAGCPRGGVVLDPMAGSGTTGVVARRLGRRFILIDLAYQEMQRQRLTAER
jgi:DNA modification methylase